MTRLVLGLIPVAFLVALIATWLARRIGLRMQALDGGGVVGQVKEAPRKVPNIGGVGIVVGFALPLALGLLFLATGGTIDPHDFNLVPADLHEHMAGLASKGAAAWSMLGCVLVLHVLGLIDDRRPLGPWLKLAIMLGVAWFAVWSTDTRLLTLLDNKVGGPWLSMLVTVLWIAVVINALNFLDNMDALAGGVAAVAAASFSVIALVHEQWFVAACFALLLGSLLGFLRFNRPPASIFMGDGGSLVVGFLLALLSVRITYASFGELTPSPIALPPWYAALTPLVVLAVPLYDFTSVVLLRLSQGKCPFVGDLQHVSHRFVRRGLTKPMAVLTICGFAIAAGIAGVMLARARTQLDAILITTLMLVLLGVIAIMEFSRQESPKT